MRCGVQATGATCSRQRCADLGYGRTSRPASNADPATTCTDQSVNLYTFVYVRKL